MRSKHVGRTYGKLTVTGVAKTYTTKSGAFVQVLAWRCECGATGETHLSSVTGGQKSACRTCTMQRLGHTPQHELKRSWRAMIARCENPKSDKYKNYGARGIQVCDRWRKSFEAFLEDMGERPVGTSIERVDNSGNYEPGNCRWATLQEQNNNKRNNRRITVSGKCLTLAQWCRELGITTSRMAVPLRQGFTHEQAIKLFIERGTDRNIRWIAIDKSKL